MQAAPPNMERAKVRSGPSGYVVVSRANADGMVKPAPAPWMARATDMKIGFLAKPQTRDQTANQLVPIKKMRRWPNKSPYTCQFESEVGKMKDEV